MAVDLLIHTGWLLLFAGFDTNFKDIFFTQWLILYWYGGELEHRRT